MGHLALYSGILCNVVHMHFLLLSSLPFLHLASCACLHLVERLYTELGHKINSKAWWGFLPCAGSILAFEVANQDHADQIMASVQIMTPAVSLGSTDTLIQQPAGLTHRIIGDAALVEGGIEIGLLRGKLLLHVVHQPVIHLAFTKLHAEVYTTGHRQTQQAHGQQEFGPVVQGQRPGFPLRLPIKMIFTG